MECMYTAQKNEKKTLYTHWIQVGRKTKTPPQKRGNIAADWTISPKWVPSTATAVDVIKITEITEYSLYVHPFESQASGKNRF